MARKFDLPSMKREYPSLSQLEAEYGHHKEIPEKFREVILQTLFHFPELKETRIVFKLVNGPKKNQGAAPSVMRLLVPNASRNYTVKIPDEAVSPHDQALLKNLPYEAQVAAIAHELAIISFFENKNNLKAIKLLRRNKDQERELRRKADLSVIERGLGFELYVHATFLRRIPGFLEERKDIDINSLNPNEILEALPPEQLQEVHRF